MTSYLSCREGGKSYQSYDESLGYFVNRFYSIGLEVPSQAPCFKWYELLIHKIPSVTLNWNIGVKLEKVES